MIKIKYEKDEVTIPLYYYICEENGRRVYDFQAMFDKLEQKVKEIKEVEEE